MPFLRVSLFFSSLYFRIGRNFAGVAATMASMKKLKLDHDRAQAVVAGRNWSTWRLYDDKDLTVNDTVQLLDKVDPGRPQTWKVIGTARINRIIEKRLGDIGDEDYESGSTEPASSVEERLARYRGYYGDSVTAQTPVKMVYFDFEPADDTTSQQVTADVGQGQLAPRLAGESVIIYTDGGSRGNPGHSASGYVIMDSHEHVLVDKGVYLGITTNNQAEYQALKFALEEAKRMGAKEVSVRMDSMLVVNQMKGVFKVSNRDLWPVHDAIKKLAGSFRKIHYSHVPRELNKLADSAVNRVLDEVIAQNRQQRQRPE